MLIEIDIDKTRLEAVDPRKNKVPELFSEIARSSRLGYHRIIISPEVANLITDVVSLNDRERAIIKKIGQEHFDLSSQKKHNRPLLNVVYGDYEIKKRDNTWNIGHEKLIEGKFLDQPVLLTEAATDYKFFEFLFNAIAEQEQVGALKFTREQGGGNNMHENFSEHVKFNKRAILCICDSDRLVPKGKIGNTFETVSEVANSHEFIGIATCTPGHEAENFLPFSTFTSIRSGITYSNNLDFLINSQIKKQKRFKKGKSLWLFYDTKSGVNEDKLKDNCMNRQQEIWVENFFGDFFKSDEHENLPIFGENVLSEFIDDSDKMKSERKKFLEFIKNDENWNKDFFDWICECIWFVCGYDSSKRTF